MKFVVPLTMNGRDHEGFAKHLDDGDGGADARLEAKLDACS
jgi:hypothetical protein